MLALLTVTGAGARAAPPLPPAPAPSGVRVTLAPERPFLVLGSETELSVSVEVTGPGADSMGSGRTFATVGTLEVEPGGSNVVPGRATGTLDVRAPDPARRDAVVAAIRTACPEASLERLANDDGVQFDARIRTALHEAAGAVAIDLASYAGHDAGVLQAAGVPAGMLFVRSPDGVSHDPAEHADEADCLAAIEVLQDTLRACLATFPPNAG